MEFLVLSPPVCTPAEPPSGAFLLAAGLAGHGRDTGLLDLSLEFYWRVLTDPETPGPDTSRALAYMLDTVDGYEPLAHRSAAGLLHKKLKGFGKRYPGWGLSLMDVVTPGIVHDPVALGAMLERDGSPFESLWSDVLDPALERWRPRTVLVSLAYLSQLAASIDLVRHLEERGVDVIVGGSLPNSLERTGEGLGALRDVFPRIELGDGRSLLEPSESRSLLDRLAWPELLSERAYMSARPIVPMPLSVGCYWDRCLFCPDRGMGYTSVPTDALASLAAGMPPEVRTARPVVHLLDSALPPARLKRFLPIAREHGLDFYGFARPTRHLLSDDLLERAAESGCLMLQLGVEGGDGPLLDRYGKGLDPAQAEAVLQESARVGIRTYLYLLFGLPGETQVERQATLELLARNPDAVDFLNLSLFNLPQSCELTERAEEFGIELEEFPEDGRIRLYRPFHTVGARPREDARHFLDRVLRRDPRVRPAVRRTPRWLRAAHLALMRLEGRR
jgi:hypothetical protein